MTFIWLSLFVCLMASCQGNSKSASADLSTMIVKDTDAAILQEDVLNDKVIEESKIETLIRQADSVFCLRDSLYENRIKLQLDLPVLELDTIVDSLHILWNTFDNGEIYPNNGMENDTLYCYYGRSLLVSVQFGQISHKWKISKELFFEYLSLDFIIQSVIYSCELINIDNYCCELNIGIMVPDSAWFHSFDVFLYKDGSMSFQEEVMPESESVC